MVTVLIVATVAVPAGFWVGWLMGWHEHEQRHREDVAEMERLRHTIRTMKHEPPRRRDTRAPREDP